MYFRLNDLIEANDYDLMNEEVQRYSKRLDRILVYYEKKVLKEKQYKNS